MNTKALILDLDNTIYPVSDIGDEVFGPLFDMIRETGKHEKDLDAIRSEMMRRPFQAVGKKFGFDAELLTKGTEFMEELVFAGNINRFPDYEILSSFPLDKFLVTAGFKKFQESKIRRLGIINDFKEIFVLDNSKTKETKKDILKTILGRYSYEPEEYLVIGDDPDSEIKYALQLGMRALLYDKYDMQNNTIARKIRDFSEIEPYL